MKSTDSPPKKRWRLLGCLVKGPLGCLAFLLGLFGVLVIFGPKAIGSRLASLLEKHFESTYAGSLTVDDAWVGSLYGPQEIESVVLFDPEGGEIMRARIKAPSFAALLDNDSESTWGPIEIRIETIQLVEDASGRTNLDRALARVEDEKSAGSRLERDLTLDPFNVELLVDRLSWSDERGRAFVVLDLRCSALFTDLGDEVRMEASGQATVEGRSVPGISFEWDIENVCAGSLEGSEWTFGLDTDPAPVALLEAMFASVSDLETTFGEQMRTCHLRMSGDRDGVRRIDEFVVDADRVYAELAATWPEGSELVSGGDDVATFRFSSDTELADDFLTRTLPLVDEVELDASRNNTELRLVDFVLPINGGLEGLRASCEIDGDDWTFRFVERVRDRFKLDGRRAVHSPTRFRVEERQLWYENLTLPARAGSLLINGSYALDEAEYGLILTLPDDSSFEITGTRADLSIEASVR